MGYFDLAGESVTSKIKKSTRPADIAYVMVNAEIPLKHIQPSFTDDETR